MALNYEDLDLNEYLFSKDSPLISKESSFQALQATGISRGAFKTQIDIGAVSSGGAYIRIDGVNGRIISNDGTANRIVIGDV